jgi:hypothetical protein
MFCLNHIIPPLVLGAKKHPAIRFIVLFNCYAQLPCGATGLMASFAGQYGMWSNVYQEVLNCNHLTQPASLIGTAARHSELHKCESDKSQAARQEMCAGIWYLAYQEAYVASFLMHLHSKHVAAYPANVIN